MAQDGTPSLTSERIIKTLRHNERLSQLHERHIALRGELELPAEAIPDPTFLTAVENTLWCFPKYTLEPDPDEASSGADEAASPPPKAPPAPKALLSRRASARGKPCLRDEMPASFRSAPGVLEAVDAFDSRNMERSARAEGVLRSAIVRRHDPRSGPATEQTVQEVGRNRYLPPEPPEPPAQEPYKEMKRRWTDHRPASEPVPPLPSGWTLEGSIWGPRRLHNDSLGYFTTRDTLRRAAKRDFSKAVRERGLGTYIAASVFAAFYHYALGEGGGARSIFRVQPGEWHAFVGDVGLAVAGSSHCDAPHLGILFVGVNAAGERVRRAEAQRERQEGRSSPRAGEAADSKSLCRGEWVELLVRVAVSRFVLSGELSDVSEAVKTLLEQVVVPQLGRQVLHDANEFRRTCCYTEAVDAVLREHEQSLRAMFERYAAADSQGERDGTRWLGYAEWAEFVEDLGLIDGAFTLREATLCFACSRMLVVDETTPLGWRRTTNLTFEDFLEAFVRAALLKPLPTPAEVQKAGYRDAGEFVLKMRTDDPAGWNNWATKHTVTWEAAMQAEEAEPGKLAYPKLRQPVERCVEALLMLMVRTADVSGDARISRQEAAMFDSKN